MPNAIQNNTPSPEHKQRELMFLIQVPGIIGERLWFLDEQEIKELVF